jgi:hypothetical protein
MNTKLTLNIDKSVIKNAKIYASSRHISLSRLVEEYLRSLSSGSDNSIPVAPLTKELSTIIKNKPAIDQQEIIEDYLISKYLK